MDMAPSLVFRRNCYVTMWFEKAGLSQRSYLGVNNILWQSEFPIDTSTWPRSKEVIKRNFAGIPRADRDKVLGGKRREALQTPGIAPPLPSGIPGALRLPSRGRGSSLLDAVDLSAQAKRHPRWPLTKSSAPLTREVLRPTSKNSGERASLRAPLS